MKNLKISLEKVGIMADILTNNLKKEQIKKITKNFIIENIHFGEEDVNLSGEDSFLQSGIIDSTGILELVSFIEEQFLVYVEDDEMTPENLDSLNSVADFIKQKMTNSKRGSNEDHYF
jgi:acyl carrier protein